jgi:hypothetical protein
VKLLRLLSPAILALALLPAAANAGTTPQPTFAEMVQALGGGFEIPPEWSGVWQYQDSTYDCDDNLLTTDSGEDTLCAGDPYEEAPPGYEFSCSGTVTSTVVDLVCTVSFMVATCTVEITIDLEGTRTGETATYVETITTTYSGGLECDFFPDTCERTRGTITRIGPAPKSCFTPTEPSSWGKVKLRYR